MAQSFIQVPTDGTGKKLDTQTTTTAAQHRQVVSVGDKATDAAIAPVSATLGLTVNVSNTSIPVTDNGTTLSIDDGAGNISIDDGGNSITVDDGAGSLTVDGTVAATQSGTWTVQPGNTANTTPWLTKLHDGTNAITFVQDAVSTSAFAVPVMLHPDSVNANGQATLANSAPVAIASDQSKIPVHGDTAHDAADANSPVKIGGQARTTNPTAVADADRTNAIFDKLGKQITVGAIRELKAYQFTTITSSTAETTIITAGGAGVFCDPYSILLANTSATQCNVTIKEATAGSSTHIICVPPGETRGFTLPVDSAIKQTTANNNWTATCSASVAAMNITALYVKNT